MRDIRKQILHNITPFIGFILFGIALAIVYHEVRVYHWHEIKGAFLSIPPSVLVLMAVITGVGYVVTSFYDYLALAYIHEKLSYPRVLLASFLSFAVSNTVGHAIFSGGSLRYRFYSNWGVSALSVAKIVLFCSLTYIVGSLTIMVGGYFSLHEHLAFANDHVRHSVALLAWVSAFLMAAWWAAILLYRKPIHLKQFTFQLPHPLLALAQLGVAVVDLLLAGLVLYLPLLHFVGISFQDFLVLYIAAQLIGLFSQVPGGIGVFEGAFLFLASERYPSSSLFAALLAYRAVYYFLPLGVAGALLVLYEMHLRRVFQSAVVKTTVSTIKVAMPQILSVLLLMGAVVLLLSGATPGESDRLSWLHYFVPLPLIEFSHLIASITGVAMLFLARAVQQRMDSAYYATIVMLLVGIVASLAKGWDFEEASILTTLLLVILPSRRLFYRKSALLTLDYPVRWLVLIFSLIGLSVWLGFFSYRHVEYANDLWWHMSLKNDAARFLRSLVGISVVTAGVILHQLLMGSPYLFSLPNAEELAQAEKLVRASKETMSNLALLGDKYLFWSETKNSFVMFDVTTRVWIALGDPIGNPAEFEDLIWHFRELADRYGARLAFYQVGQTYLPYYIDQGLSLIKLGEEARIPLSTFTLEGKKTRNLRNALHKQERENLTLTFLYGDDVDAVMPELARISRLWLKAKKVREKRFSLGFFEPRYIKRCGVAIVRKDDRILAFANLWPAADKEEFSIDLMRYDPEAFNGLMEYLMVQLILWAKEQGYKWFNLGMAPLSGLEAHPLSPLWHKIGNTIFRLGTEFYNFEGLYQYKNKFGPVWSPRYLAAPAGLQAASTLLSVMGLISGGITGVIKE